MNRNLDRIMVGIVCVLFIVCIVRITALEHAVESWKSSERAELSRLHEKMDGITQKVQETIVKESNLLAKEDWEYQKIDWEKQQVIVHATILPKQYVPATTKAILFQNEKEYEMYQKDGIYCADITIPLYQESRVTGVSLLDQGEKRIQMLDWCFSPRYEYLPMIYSQYQGSSSVEAQGNVYKEKWEGPIWIQVENRIEENQIQSASLIYLLDQKEIKRTNIGLDKKSQQAYIEKVGNSYEENVVETQSAEEQENAMQDYYYYLEDTISIPFGSEIAVYVEMVDTAGLKYRSLCTVQKFDKKGNPIESRLEGYIGAEPDIYDANGNLVYSANEENLYEER